MTAAEGTQDTLATCFWGPGAESASPTPPVSPSRQAPEPSPVPKTVRISLRLEGMMVTLLAGSVVSIGRNRGCDITPPQVTEGDERGRRLRLRVSRRHCEILRGSNGWRIRDGVCVGPGKFNRSSFGTWWTGCPVVDEIEFGTTPGILSLGGASLGDAVAFDVRTIGRSLLVKPRQAAGEAYVLLDGSAPLAPVDGRLADVFAEWRPDGFWWRMGANRGRLTPGTDVPDWNFKAWVE